MSQAQEAVSFLGAGDLYMDRLNADGTRNGLLKVGAAMFSLQSNAEIKEQTAKGRDNYGQVIASATIAQPPQVNINLTELNRNALAMNFLGNLDDLDVAADTVDNEGILIENLDRFFRLSHRNLTAGTVSVNRPNGSLASAWQADTVYAVGDFVVPDTPNEHFYKVTESTGDQKSHADTEPTWPTDGTTVTDEDVTWQDMGLIEPVEDACWDAIYRTGMVRALPGGTIEAGETIEVTYGYGAYSGGRVMGAVQPTIKAYLFLDGINQVDGKDVEVEVWEAQIRPTSPVDFLADDFTALEMEGTPVTPPTKASPFIITYID